MLGCAQLEAGSSLGHEARQMRPADVLIPNWELGKPAAFDLCVTSSLNSETLQVACVTPSSAAMQQNRGSIVIIIIRIILYYSYGKHVQLKHSSQGQTQRMALELALTRVKFNLS